MLAAVAGLGRVGNAPVVGPGLPGLSSSVGTSMAWASGRPDICLWIGKVEGVRDEPLLLRREIDR